MNYVILDLEWNGNYSRKFGGYINEIIEFGAIKLDENMQIIGQFSTLVRPDLTQKLSSRVKDLTSLTNDELKRGNPFPYAYSKFKKFAKNCVIMSWSTSDIVTLISNCQYYLKSSKLDFIKKYVDLQLYCQEMMGISSKNQIGLVAAAETLGLNVDDIPHHRAVGDCIVSAKCLQKLYSKGAMKAYIQNIECGGFFDNLESHTSYIYNIDNPLIDKSLMTINCNLCGARADIKEPWEQKNKSFYSYFECPECHNSFRAKIQFRKKQNKLIPVKKLSVPNLDDETEKTEV